jgi:hypothetical protein
MFSFVLFVIVGVLSLLGWCTLGGAAVSAAPTELLVLFFDWCTFCFVGALETSAPPCDANVLLFRDVAKPL